MMRRLPGLVLVAQTVLLTTYASGQSAPNMRHRGSMPPVHGTALVDATRIPIGDSPVDGPSDALVTIVVFGDARDYFTIRLERTLAEIRARYGDDVRFVWKTHPHAMLDPQGERTADALMAAHAQQHFWPMLEWVMAHPTVSTDAQFAEAARASGLDVNRFNADLQSHAQRAQVEADARLARSLAGPDVTPTVYVNGTRVIGAHASERFFPLVDAALTAARAVTPREQAYATALQSPPADPEGTPTPAVNESRVVDLTQRYRMPVDHAPVYGRADAPVTIVSFEDFECPACASVEPILARLKQHYGADLRIVWRNLPLWVHPNAIPAAEAGLAVHALGGDTAFWRFHDALYGNAGRGNWLARPALEAAAAPLGIDMNRFRAMLDSHQTHAGVHDDLRLAARFGITATPGFFINGRMVTGVQPYERFVRLIDAARDEARALVAHGTAAADVYRQLTSQGPERVMYLPIAAGSAPERPEPRYTLPDDATRIRGIASAPITISWYGEFESLVSARLAQTIERLRTAHADIVRVVFHDLPPGGRPAAMPIAEAGREILAQQGPDGFFRFADTLLANQRALTVADLERYAADQHADVTRLRAAMSAHTHVPAIRAERDALQDIGVGGDAPMVFLNGRLLTGAALNDDAFERALTATILATVPPNPPAASVAPVVPPPSHGRGRRRGH